MLRYCSDMFERVRVRYAAARSWCRTVAFGCRLLSGSPVLCAPVLRVCVCVVQVLVVACFVDALLIDCTVAIARALGTCTHLYRACCCVAMQADVRLSKHKICCWGLLPLALDPPPTLWVPQNTTRLVGATWALPPYPVCLCRHLSCVDGVQPAARPPCTVGYSFLNPLLQQPTTQGSVYSALLHFPSFAVDWWKLC